MSEKKRKYPSLRPGQWVTPKRKYYNLMCCTCGLTHKMELGIRGRSIGVRFWLDNRATAAARRGKRYADIAPVIKQRKSAEVMA